MAAECGRKVRTLILSIQLISIQVLFHLQFIFPGTFVRIYSFVEAFAGGSLGKGLLRHIVMSSTPCSQHNNKI